MTTNANFSGPARSRGRAFTLATLALPVFGGACQPSGEAATLAEQITSDDGQETGPSLAPDGSIAFDKGTAPTNVDIYVVRDGGTPVNLTADSPVNDFQPAFSPDGQSIAFRSAREGGGIFVMSESGGPARRVVEGPGFNPSWSPDGRQILYGMISAALSPYAAGTTTMGLRVVDVESGETREITPAYAFAPQMSPDGGRVAYWALGGTEEGGVQRDIWSVRADGTEPVQVTADDAVDWSPIWSPDGGHLYFASDRDGAMKIWRFAIDQATGVTTGEAELVTADEGAQIRGHLSMSADGTLAYMDRTELRSLFAIGLDAAAGTTTPASPVTVPGISPAGVVDSPDGQWLAFGRGTAGQEDLFVMRSDGTGFQQLTDDPYRDRVPQWSPDGTRIAFRSDRPIADGTRPYLWYQINRDGSDLRLLAASSALNLSWSPDGARGALHGGGLIVLFDAGGSEGRVVVQSTPESPVAVTVPVWSSDSRRLAYRETRGPQNTIFVLDDGDASDPRVVRQVQGALNNPVWSPDGRRLAFRQPGASGGTFVVDATRAGATPERLPAMDFNPTFWGADGNLLMGVRPAAGELPVAPLLYDFSTRRYELLAESGVGGQWTRSGSHVFVTNDGGSKLQIIDRATKTVRDVFSVTPPATFIFNLSSNERTVYYLVAGAQADVYRIRVR